MLLCSISPENYHQLSIDFFLIEFSTKKRQQNGFKILELVGRGHLFAIEYIRIVLADVAVVIVYQLLAWVSHTTSHTFTKTNQNHSFVYVVVATNHVVSDD